MANSSLQKPFIGLKAVWYGEVVNKVTTPDSGYTAAELKALKSTLTSVRNVHQDTWGYDESDPSVTDYIDELTGQPYYRDVTEGAIPTVNFTMGQYSFEDKAAFQGGKGTEEKWERGNMTEPVEKCILAQTKTGNYIFIPRANIIGKGSFVEKNIGLGVSAVPLVTNVEGLASEIWFKGDAIDTEAASMASVSGKSSL